MDSIENSCTVIGTGMGYNKIPDNRVWLQEVMLYKNMKVQTTKQHIQMKNTISRTF